MKITFPALVSLEREVDLTHSDVESVFSLMEETLLFYAEFHDFRTSGYSSPFEPNLKSLCKKFEIDITSKRELVPFVKALVAAVKTSRSD